MFMIYSVFDSVIYFLYDFKHFSPFEVVAVVLVFCVCLIVCVLWA